MALQLDYDYKGVNCNYWLVGQYGWNKEQDSTAGVLLLYKDAEARQASLGNSLFAYGFNFAGNLSIAQVYAQVKTLADFETALDV